MSTPPVGRACSCRLYKRHCLARTLQHADAVVALTVGQAQFLAHEYDIAPRRLVVVPNGVDRVFLELGTARGQGRPLHVLFVGRLDAQKNIPRLLRAVAQVTEPVEVVVVGDGDQRERCESIRDQLGVDHVRFVGAQHGRDLVRWYDWADLFVLPSDREGMPLALLEAMAAGLAVVTTDVSELGDQVGDGGLVVPAGANRPWPGPSASWPGIESCWPICSNGAGPGDGRSVGTRP